MLTAVVPKLPFIDKQANTTFYLSLGFALTSDYGDYTIMHKDAAELHFFSYPTLVPAKSDFMIYLRVDEDIANLYEACKAAGLQFASLGKLEQKPWGQTEFSLLDPNGTLLTFGQSVNV